MRCQECRHWTGIDGTPTMGVCAIANRKKPSEYLRKPGEYCTAWECNTRPMRYTQGKDPISVTTHRMRDAAVKMQKAASGLSHLGYKEMAHTLRMASLTLLQWKESIEKENATRKN